MRLPVLSLPAGAFEPLQPPLAVQAVALELDQFSVVPCPLATVVSVADSTTTGTGGALTETVTSAVALPPSPVHVSV